MRQIPISRPNISYAEVAAVAKVLRSGHLAQGQQVSSFESAFARFCGTKYAIACNNGTTALMMALLASTDLDPFFKPLPWNNHLEVWSAPHLVDFPNYESW